MKKTVLGAVALAVATLIPGAAWAHHGDAGRYNEETVTLKGREVLMIREEVLPLLRLRQLLHYEGDAPRGLEQVVVVEMAERRAAMVVDALIGQQEIVVKQFDGVQNGLTLFGGATILGDGAPALIIDVSSLL